MISYELGQGPAHEVDGRGELEEMETVIDSDGEKSKLKEEEFNSLRKGKIDSTKSTCRDM